MKILITGGAGYIGSHAVKVFLDKGYEVYTIDNLSTGSKKAIDKRARFIEGNVGDTPFVEKILKQEHIDRIIHFAGSSQVKESMSDAKKYFENNVIETIHLLNAFTNAGGKYFVFSSSAAVYGEANKMPIEESTPRRPTNVYGETKKMIEQILYWYHLIYNFSYVSLRYFNVAGCDSESGLGERHNPETHVIPLAIQACLGIRDHFSLYGTDYSTPDGTCIRDYIHVLDLVEAHYCSMRYLENGNPSDVFNLGSGKGYSVNEIIETTKKVTGIDFKVEKKDRRIGDPSILVASCEKANYYLHYHPKHTSLSEMIDSAYQFYLKEYSNDSKKV
jgi:UDP-glucose 4-epimerase